MKKYIPVLAYHSFDTNRFPQNKLAIDSELFSRQMGWLKAGHYELIPLSECAQAKGVSGFFDKKVALTFDDGYLDNYACAYATLRHLGFPGTFFVTPETIGDKGFMTWQMVSEMARTPGVEIGSHGLFHKPLADIAGPDALRSIVESKKQIEDKIGVPVRAFSYPSGSFTETIVEYVKEAGYEYACAASHVHDRKYLQNPYLIRRIKISFSSTTQSSFALRTSGFYHLFGRP